MVSNLGHQEGTNIVVTDLFPNDILTINSISDVGIIGSNSLVWNLPSLEAGAEKILTVNATVRLDAGVSGIT